MGGGGLLPVDLKLSFDIQFLAGTYEKCDGVSSRTSILRLIYLVSAVNDEPDSLSPF